MELFGYTFRRGHRKRSPRQMFIEEMTTRGAKWDWKYSSYDWTDGDDDRFIYLAKRDCVYVCVKKHFDRWSNSVDFVFSFPKTKCAFLKKMRKLDSAYRSGNYNKGWGMRLWL